MQDPYEILGVSKNSTDSEIKTIFRKLSKKYHPDLNLGSKNAENKFKEIKTAFDLICNKECREKYEQQKQQEEFIKQQSQKSQRQAPFYYETQNPQGKYSSNFSGNYEDILSSVFGDKFKNANIENDFSSQDVRYSLQIRFEEAVLGTEKEIVLAKGLAIKVKIPPGIESGTTLRFKGQGMPNSKKNSHGDAYVEIQVASSSSFKKDDNNLRITIPITIYEAINGAEIEVPVVGGNAILVIPPNVNTHTKLRMKNKGYRQKAKDNYGDQIVELIVKLPVNSDSELSDFISSWGKKHPYNPRK